MIKKNVLTFLLLLVVADLFAQTFPNDRAKFPKQLATVISQSATTSDQEFIKNKLTPFLLSESNITTEAFNQMVETCNLMDVKKFRFYPEIYQYVYATYALSVSKISKQNYDNWYKILSAYIEGKTTTKAKEFISFSYDFFDNNTLGKRSNYEWKFIGGAYSIYADKDPRIELVGGKLVCNLGNNSSGGNYKIYDSIVVKNTNGSFYPMKDEFYGKGGLITWEKVGLDPNAVFAEVATPYKVNTATSRITVDTVWMKTPQFQQKVKGTLSDMAYNINREADKTNPKFRSFEKSLRIKDFEKGIDYIGGFKYEGASFIGSAVGNTPAKLVIYNKQKPFIDVFSDIIIKDAKKVTANDARVVFHLSAKDSIVQSGLSFVYFSDSKTFEFTRGESGASSAPFVNSYHKLNMFVPKIVWVQDSTKLNLTYGKELSGELRFANFESFDYFSKERYNAMQGMASTHPLVLLYNFCYKYDEFNIDEARFATALGRTVDQAIPMLLTMEQEGYILRDSKTKKVIVTDKVKKIIETNKGLADYDNIIFKSDLRLAKMPPQYTAEQISHNVQLQQLDSLIKSKNAKRKGLTSFGEIDLVTLDLNLNAIEKIDLSESKQTLIIPDNDKVSVHANRNFNFSGWVKSGRVEINVLKGNYDYAKNTVNLDKTTNTIIGVQPLRKEDGERTIFLNSFITDAQGVLKVDEVTNRSGLKKTTQNYPMLEISNSAKVYYNHPAIQSGAYDSTRFYFALQPFVMDSLLAFSNQDVRFKGDLISAGIFPKFPEQLRIMPDYSLGFMTASPQGGYPFYETKAKYENKIMLSNSGLQGSGKIEFIKSTSESAQFTFLPDSTIGTAKFTNLPVESGVEFPDVNGQKVNISYNPRKQYINVYSLENPILMFKDIQYIGQITLKNDGMTGNGLIVMPDANLKSRQLKFTRWHAKSDVADFNLTNKFAEEGEGGLSFVTKNVDSDLDFKEKVGVFKPNKSNSRTEFPLNNFYCIMDKYTWYMSNNDVVLEQDKGKEVKTDINIDAGLGLATPNFFSTNPKQDSLSLQVPKAVFSLKVKTIHCDKIAYVDIADARIFPKDGKINILKKGVIEELVDAKITANYVTKYHNFEEVKAKILARRNYEAVGKYPYKDADNKTTLIDMSRIYVDSSFQTIAIGTIKPETGFQLSKMFDYYGKVKVISTDPLITFDGATRINHNCTEFAKSWMAFKAPIDPKNIQIPVANDMKTLDGESVTAGLVWRDARNPDSVRIYPAFLSKIQSAGDNRIITATGLLQYNPTSKEFQISTPEKLLNRAEKGNYLSLHTETCSLNGDGKIELGMDYGDVAVVSYGIVNYDNTSKATTMNITAKFIFPKIDKGIFEKMATKIAVNESLKPLDLTTSTLEQTITEIKDKKAADAFKNELIQKGFVKNALNEFEDGIVITGIQLKSNYDGLNNGLKTSVSSASVVNILNKSVNKQIPFKAFFKQTYSGNVSGDKLQFDMDIPGGKQYFFDYGMEKKNGTLQIYSNDDEFQESVLLLKADKKKYKSFSYDTTENSGIMSSFIRLF